jgi:hypothetical protein
LDTNDGFEQAAAKYLIPKHHNSEKQLLKTSTAEHFEVSDTHNLLAKSTFGLQHRLYISPPICATLARDAKQLDVHSTIVADKDKQDFNFQQSTMSTPAEAILTVMCSKDNLSSTYSPEMVTAIT